MKRRTAWLITLILLLVPVLGAWGCNPQESIPLAQAGFQIQVYAHAAAKTGNAFNTLKPEKLSNLAYRAYLDKVHAASDLGQRLFVTIDNTPVIGPSNKIELLTAIDGYLVLLDSIVADGLFKSLPQELRNTIALLRTLASGVKLAIASIKINTPAERVIANVPGANAQAKRAAKITQQDVVLVQRLTEIVAETTADVLSGQGMAVAQLREMRVSRYTLVGAYINNERARLNR